MIKVEDYTPIVTDFNIFLDFCSTIKPKLTKTREFINRKSLYELNQKLSLSTKDITPKSDESKYFGKWVAPI